MGKWGKRGGITGPGGRVSPGPKVTVQPKRMRMRLGSAGGVYVSSLVREGGARHRPSAGAGLRVCRRLLGDGPSTFLGWVVLPLGVAVGSIGKGSMLPRTTTCQFVWMEAGCPVESGEEMQRPETLGQRNPRMWFGNRFIEGRGIDY